MADVPENEQQDENDGGMDRRSVLKYGGTGAVAAGLAGCQSPENPVPGGQVRVNNNNGGGGGTGEGDGDGALAGEIVRIGVLAPMNMPLGQSIWDGARLAAKQMNESDGLLGATVEVKLGDTELSPGKAESEHRRLIVQENCDITCGIFLGSALLQTFPSIANQEKLHITTASAEPRAGELVSQNQAFTNAEPMEEYERFKYHFRAGPIHLLDLADAMLELVEGKKEKFGWERAALLVENIGELTPYSNRLQDRLSDVIDVPISERPGGISDWSPLYNEIEGENCDVAIVGMALSGTTAANQWAQQERDFEFGGIHVPSQAYNYWESTDGNVEHIFTMNAMTPQTENTSKTQKFVNDYMNEFDRVPIYTGPLTYDAITLLEDSVRRTVEEEGMETMPDADTMIPYMEEMTFTGSTVMDEFQFTAPDAEYAHEPLWTSIEETGVPVFQQWQLDPEVREDYGTMHSFFPPQNKTADYAVPEWIKEDS
ncbi:MAG: branched-chain amino acid transport system substrate-binding protein [Natronomonas sp.]|jgi:branched-chain amino acid transport system substrate-binding protein|uniref:substrate-binding domain-containing protein n=1 Tax=Natronomonas sp. TaxID=2184060 RepID=UPI003988C0E9